MVNAMRCSAVVVLAVLWSRVQVLAGGAVVWSCGLVLTVLAVQAMLCSVVLCMPCCRCYVVLQLCRVVLTHGHSAGAVRCAVAVWCSKLARAVMARLNQDMAGPPGTLRVSGLRTGA